MLGTQNNLPYLKWTVHNKDQLNGLADLVNRVHIFKSGNFSVAVVVFLLWPFLIIKQQRTEFCSCYTVL